MAQRVYIVGECKYSGINCQIQAKNNYSANMEDSTQVLGEISGIIRYYQVSDNIVTYYHVIYFTSMPGLMPPRLPVWRTDNWTRITEPQQPYPETVTVYGNTYYAVVWGSIYYFKSTSTWKIDNVSVSDVTLDNDYGGGDIHNIIHDLGDRSNKTKAQVILEGLQYLLNESDQPIGRGTVTLSIKKPGQTLFFTSRLLGNTFSQYISGDASINMEDPVVENYSIEGLLNTETAYDSYCTYGYHIEGDSRLFCAVKVYGLFYASIRESAYIKIYLYYKGNDTPSMKTINNTGEEYSESISYKATSDPNIFKISKNGSFMIWTNQNGSSATMNDIISNAPILEGNDLSDSEREALAINYLNGLT